VEIEQLVFEVLEVERRRISKVRVRRQPEAAEGS
jgi:CBS domain containing-hemolysin-like protein